ncbi:cyclin-like protein [Crepidotus variabilis]|uniref:Cyclin-like protein n=1 Tax=Crepidotus variabilis TaxID=179855 RepID=A0A9P6EBC6_9AGAR|nr:cyclin-like protein [Crepidotus variabilis]
MSSIPVRRTSRVARSTARDNENANARPSRVAAATRGAATKVGATTASSKDTAGSTVTRKSTIKADVTSTRATTSTIASKAKAIEPSGVGKDGKEAIGAKRKREALVEVTTLVTNNHRKTASTSSGLSGKDVKETRTTAVVNVASIKSKTVVKPPTGRATRQVVTARQPREKVARAASESTTASSKDTGSTLDKDGDEIMEPAVEVKAALTKPKREIEEDDEVKRVFKKRHTEEKEEAKKTLTVPSAKKANQDLSQLDADKVALQLEPAESSPSAQLWDDLDAEDWDDPVMVSEYVVDICKYLQELEVATLPRSDYMSSQPEINWEHRGVLVDWLLQVHARFNLLAESLFLTVNLLDRFLSLKTIHIPKLQLVGLACFFTATKYEETYAPSVREIAFLADEQYTVDEILKAERYILRTLEWDLRAPGPMGWLRRGSKADDCEVHARTLGKYLIEISCVERKLVGVKPSLVSAAALWIARMTLGREEWTANLEHYTTFSEKELLPTAKIMLEYINTEPVPHQSLYKKYAHKRYYRCSKFVRDWCLEKWAENTDINLARDLPALKEVVREARGEWEKAELEAGAAAAVS